MTITSHADYLQALARVETICGAVVDSAEWVELQAILDAAEVWENWRRGAVVQWCGNTAGEGKP